MVVMGSGATEVELPSQDVATSEASPGLKLQGGFRWTNQTWKFEDDYLSHSLLSETPAPLNTDICATILPMSSGPGRTLVFI